MLNTYAVVIRAGVRGETLIAQRATPRRLAASNLAAWPADSGIEQTVQAFTRRREAWQFARQMARQNQAAAIYDGLLIEPPTYIDYERGRFTYCHCTAEARLLRAIFGEGHPREPFTCVHE